MYLGKVFSSSVLIATDLSRVVPGAHVAECGPDAVLNGGKVRYELEVGEAVEGGRGIAAQRVGGWIITTQLITILIEYIPSCKTGVKLCS